MGASLRALGLKYVYPSGIEALGGVDFAAEAGQFVVLLGPNGSGKSTLLRHFNGLLHATEGRVVVDGKEVRRGEAGWLHWSVGFVFQDPNDQLFATSVAEDVAFGPRNMALLPEEVMRRVAIALDMVGLSGFESRAIHSLSFGQKRRAALAGVLAMRPSALVLDEPTAGLDPLGASRLMALLQRLNDHEGVTIVLATHDIDLVPAYAEQVYVLHGGRVVASGSPPEVFGQPDLMRRSELRIPRAAHVLRLVGAEIGHPLSELPITLDELSPLLETPYTTPCVGRSRGDGGVDGARGFTTGAAAAAAAKAAGEMLFHGRRTSVAELRSPVGTILEIPIAHVQLHETADGQCAVATVIKDAGDGRDVTHGAEISATVTMTDEVGIIVEGGQGVGRVVSPGLPVSPGRPAINPVPRQMIADALSTALPHRRGAKVVIAVRGGEEMATRTLNPQAGIEGGIAILGTTGLMLRSERGNLEQ